jgi:hypothetical protein
MGVTAARLAAKMSIVATTGHPMPNPSRLQGISGASCMIMKEDRIHISGCHSSLFPANIVKMLRALKPARNLPYTVGMMV